MHGPNFPSRNNLLPIVGNKATDAPSCQPLQDLSQLQRTSSLEALSFLKQPAYGKPKLPQVSIQLILEENGEN